MTALSLNTLKLASYVSSAGPASATCTSDRAYDVITSAAKRAIGAATELAAAPMASVPTAAIAKHLCTASKGMLQYIELTRRIPKDHLDSIETRMLGLSRDPEEVERQIANIKKRLSDGAYDSLPENFFYYGLLGVQSERLSVEQFSILTDYLTLSAQGVKSVVAPLFYKNEEGDLVINRALADNILFTLKGYKEFPSKEEGYAFLESAFKDLPAEALQVQTYEPTFSPATEVALPEDSDPNSYEVKLIQYHDVPAAVKLYQLGFNLFIFYFEEGKWKRISVTTQLHQRFLDHVFKRHAVRIHCVLASSSLDDLRHNGRTSSRDQGMCYITPSSSERGYDYHTYDYADTYPIVDLDFRDHDRYHSWVCSSLHTDDIRYPLMRISDTLTRINNLCSYVREEDPERKKLKEEKLSERDLELACCLRNGTSKEELIAKFELTDRHVKVMEFLLNKDSGNIDLKALRHISWNLADMEFKVSGKDCYFEETSSAETTLRFSQCLIDTLYETKLYDLNSRLESLHSSHTPAAERAKKIIKERLIFPEFASLRARYEAEMLIYEGGFLPRQTNRCIRELIHGVDSEPSYRDWLRFRKVEDVDFFDSDAIALSSADELFPFLSDLSGLPPASAGAGAGAT